MHPTTTNREENICCFPSRHLTSILASTWSATHHTEDINISKQASAIYFTRFYDIDIDSRRRKIHTKPRNSVCAVDLATALHLVVVLLSFDLISLAPISTNINLLGMGELVGR